MRQFERNQGQLLEMLQRGEIDAALTYDLELSQDMTFEPLMQLPAYVMLPAAHPFATRVAITPEDLVDEPMVLLDLPYSREYFLSAFQMKGLRPSIAERTGDIAVMRSMVAMALATASRTCVQSTGCRRTASRWFSCLWAAT